MSLVWNIVRKDFRRLAGPLALWLALVVGHALLLFVWEGAAGANPVAFEGKRYFVNACGVVVMGVGFILAAWLVMEDNLVSTQAFWRTRPLGGLRLMAAKTLGAFLMFSVLPAVVLLPVWLWCGFGARELAYAAAELGLAQALCSLGAFALGAITVTSGQFLVRLLVGAIVLPLFLAWVLGVFTKTRGGDDALIAILALLTPLVMTMHQFLTRRTGRTWMIFLAGLGLMLVTGLWLPGNLTARLLPLPKAEQSAPAGLSIVGQRLIADPLQSLNFRVPLQLEGTIEGAAPDLHVRVDRVQTWWAGGGEQKPGRTLTGLAANGLLSDSSVRRAAGLSADPAQGEVRWIASGRETEEFLREVRDGQLKLGGVVGATLLRGVVLGELPVEAGAELRTGSSFTRIKSLQWADDGRLSVLIEERDAWLRADSGTYSQSYDPVRRRIRPAQDGFVVLNRARQIDLMPVVEEIGTVLADSIVVGRRNLVITPPAGAGEDWLQGAVIVKVRFVSRGKIRVPLAGEPLAPIINPANP